MRALISSGRGDQQRALRIERAAAGHGGPWGGDVHMSAALFVRIVSVETPDVSRAVVDVFLSFLCLVGRTERLMA